jgi:hypothetical protein
MKVLPLVERCACNSNAQAEQDCLAAVAAACGHEVTREPKNLQASPALLKCERWPRQAYPI